MRVRKGVAEEEPPGRVVVPAVVSVDHLVAEVRDELPGVEPQAAPDRRDPAHEGLLDVDVLPLQEPVRGRDARDRGARLEVHAEAGLARLADRLLEDDLGDVHLERVVVEVEDAQLVRAGIGAVEVVRIARGEKRVDRDLLVPGPGRGCGRRRLRSGRKRGGRRGLGGEGESGSEGESCREGGPKAARKGRLHRGSSRPSPGRSRESGPRRRPRPSGSSRRARAAGRRSCRRPPGPSAPRRRSP